MTSDATGYDRKTGSRVQIFIERAAASRRRNTLSTFCPSPVASDVWISFERGNARLWRCGDILIHSSSRILLAIAARYELCNS